MDSVYGFMRYVGCFLSNSGRYSILSLASLGLFVAILIYAFILLTLVSIKAVRNGGYGESLIFHLASTIIGLSALTYLAFRSRLELSETACRNIGMCNGTIYLT